MQNNSSLNLRPKFNPGAIALTELLAVRSVMQCETPPHIDLTDAVKADPASTQNFNDFIFYTNISSTIERGLPQFEAFETASNADDKRVCTIAELTHLASDLLTSGLMTEKRSSTINQAFENLTGHSPLIEWRRS